MAQKRMFDKGLIETDAFMDMPMSSKALYFLLGMEADDEGFVSPKRVIRIYGGTDDDLKVLIAKQFVIQFESGVVVITDWKKNNWLDSRRIKATIHQAEKKLLGESKERYHLLSNGAAVAQLEESSVEESSVEEKETAPDKPERHIGYLKNIPEPDLKEFSYRFDATEKQIKSKAEDLLLWCEAKGARKKNYRAFLLNALKRDFKEMTPEERERRKELNERVAATRQTIENRSTSKTESWIDPATPIAGEITAGMAALKSKMKMKR